MSMQSIEEEYESKLHSKEDSIVASGEKKKEKETDILQVIEHVEALRQSLVISDEEDDGEEQQKINEELQKIEEMKDE